jgi:hypothetical protein
VPASKSIPELGEPRNFTKEDGLISKVGCSSVSANEARSYPDCWVLAYKEAYFGQRSNPARNGKSAERGTVLQGIAGSFQLS